MRETLAPDSRSKQLRARTTTAHATLDDRIMAAQPFSSRERYGRFLQVQHAFYRDIDALYESPALGALLPDLAGRRRLGRIEADLADLGIAPVPGDGAPVFDRDAAVPAALGWLYVAEGSNLGAAFLLKEAIKLGLGESFGARHLAGAPEGRGLHWRTFTAALDGVALDAAGEAAVVAGANAAFTRVRALVERLMPASAAA